MIPMPVVKSAAWLNQVHREIAGGKKIQRLGETLKRERISPRQLLEACQQIETPIAWQIRRALMQGIADGTVDVHQIGSEIYEARIDQLTQERDAARQQSAQTSKQAGVEHQRLEAENQQLRAQVAQLTTEKIKPAPTESQPVAGDVPAEEAVQEMVGLLFRATNYTGTPEQIRGRIIDRFVDFLQGKPTLLSAFEEVVSSKRQESLGPLINNLLEFPENEGPRQDEARETIKKNLADIDSEFRPPEGFLSAPKTGLPPRYLGRYWLVELWRSLANHPSLGDFEKVAAKTILHKNMPDHALFRGDKLGLEQRTELYCKLLFSLNLDIIPGSLHRLMFTPGAISLFLPQISRQKIQEIYNTYNKIREEADRLLSSGVGSGGNENGIKIFLVSSLLVLLYGIGINEDRSAARATLKVWDMHYPQKLAKNISDLISQELSELKKIANQPAPDQVAKVDEVTQQAQSQPDFMGLVHQLFDKNAGAINRDDLDQLKAALQREVPIHGVRSREIETYFEQAARFDHLTRDQGKHLLSQIQEALEIVGLAGNTEAAGIAEQIGDYLVGGQQ
jgi:hypothetical protein